jgi:hypothetical protein
MTLEFLFFANVVLLLRFRLLLSDAPLPAARWWRKAACEVGLLMVMMPLTLVTLSAMVANVLVCAATIGWINRTRNRTVVHLVMGLLHLLLLSFCLGPTHDPSFRPWLVEGYARLCQLSALGPLFRVLVREETLKLMFGLLLTGNEANLFIRWVLGRLQLRPGAAIAAIDEKEYARGRVIGLLERALIYFFVLSGQYGAVGFTLAAKGFTRFKELENRSFAEYVLIGTLLSSGLSMLIAAAIRAL